MPDWKKIKAEYIRGGISYRALATKHGVSLSSITRRSSKEKWAALRVQAENNATTKIVESVASKEAKRVDRIQSLADTLLEMIEKSIKDGTLITDAKDLRAVTASIKDLREIKGYKSEIDMQEQIARIEKLRKEAQSDNGDGEIVVKFDNIPCEWAK